MARWLVSPEHPLTARVQVNRCWQQMFGVGLGKTSYDFGSQGEMPSHPELLDWLAVRFRDRGWDMKQLVRALVTSTFRQNRTHGPALRQRAPANRLLRAQAPLPTRRGADWRQRACGLRADLPRLFKVRASSPTSRPAIWEPLGSLRQQHPL